MSNKRVVTGVKIPVAFQTMSLANSTALAVNSTVRAAGPRTLMISVETQSARFRCDSTAPTLSTGVLLAAGVHWFHGYNGSTTFRFQRSTGTCKVSLMGFKYLGD